MTRAEGFESPVYPNFSKAAPRLEGDTVMLLLAMSAMGTLLARLIRRVARRYIAASGLPVGKTYQDERVRIHRYRELFELTDLTDAGKRGKRCQVLRLSLNYGYEGDRDAWFESTADGLMNHTWEGYAGVSGYAKFLHNERPDVVAIDINYVKSINVEPYGEIFNFTIKQPNGGSIEVRSSPNEFRVVDRHYFSHPTDPKKPGFFQDSSYWSSKKTDGMAFYAWMKDNHERARRFMNMNMFRSTWRDLGISYDSN